METGWNLDEVIDMPLSRLQIVADSIQWQIKQREYAENWRTAWIVSQIQNSNAQKRSQLTNPKKLLGPPPQRYEKNEKMDKNQIIQTLKEQGVLTIEQKGRRSIR